MSRKQMITSCWRAPGFRFGAVFVILTVVMWSGFTYWVGGDARLYLNEAVRICDGYMSMNLEALQDKPGSEHMVLVTEGGYQFLLAALRTVFGPVSAFWLQRLLLPLMLTFVLFIPDTPGKHASWILVACILFLMVSHPLLMEDVLLLRRPLRALPGHVLSLALVWMVVSAKEITRRRVCIWGILAGLSAWFNFPSILFGAVPVVRILQEAKWNWKSLFQYGSLLALGGLIGLSPLLCQNLFEGKAFYVIGEMDHLVTGVKTPVPKPYRHLPVEFGLHPKNLPYTLPVTLRYLFLTSPGVLWNLLLGIGVGCTLIFHRKTCVLLMAGVLPSVLFYSMFHGHIARYYLAPHLLLLVCAGIGLSQAISYLLARKNFWMRSAVWVSLLVMLVFAAPSLARLRNVKPGLHAFTYQDMMAYGRWLEAHTDEDTHFVLMHDHLSVWMNWLSNRIRPQAPWPWSSDSTLSDQSQDFMFKDKRNFFLSDLDGDEIVARLHQMVDEGTDILFLCWEPTDQKAPDLPSWWREDLAAHFQLVAMDPEIEFPSGYPYQIQAYRLKPFPAFQRIPLPPRTADEVKLVFSTRFPASESLRDADTTLHVTRNREDLVTLPWSPGTHVLTVPFAGTDEQLHLEIRGKAPVPDAIEWSKPYQYWGRGIGGRRLKRAPVDVRLFQGAYAHWMGTKDWVRDAAAHPASLAKSRYSILGAEEQRVHLPVMNRPGQFQMFLAFKGKPKPIREWTSALHLQMGNPEESSALWVLHEDREYSAQAGKSLEHGVVLISGPLTPGIDGQHIDVRIRQAVMTEQDPDLWEFKGLFFREKPVIAPKIFVDRSLASSSYFPAVAEAHPPSAWDAIHNPQVRLLDAPLQLKAAEQVPSIGWVVTQIGAWSSGWERSFGLALIGEHSQTVFSVSDGRMENGSLVLIPYEIPWSDIRVFSMEDSSSYSHALAYATVPSVIAATPDGVLPQEPDLFSREGRIVYTAKGFHPQERQPDGSSAMWSSGTASFQLPVYRDRAPGAAKSLQLEVRGPVSPREPFDIGVQFAGSPAVHVPIPDWDHGWVWVTVSIPPEALTDSLLQIKLESPVWSPAELGTSGDSRSLSFFLREVRVTMDSELRE